MPSHKLTRPQKREALLLFERGYTVVPLSYTGLPRNRALWKLVDLGLADMGDGPVGSFLKTRCFLPVWSDPIC